MAPKRVKVTRIGNSRGVRIPAETLERFGVGDELVMEERSDGILLRVPGSAPAKLSWEATAAEMEAEATHWGAWDVAAADGLEDLPWDEPPARRVAEPGPPVRRSGRRRKP